jgi:hypothetical protein
MNPQERQDFENMKREIELLKRGQNIEIASGLERIFSTTFLNVRDTDSVDDIAISQGISLSGEPETINVTRYPDRWIVVLLDGKLHRIPAFLAEFDN